MRRTISQKLCHVLLLVGKQVDWLPLSVTVPSLSRGCSASSFLFSSRSSSTRRRCGGRQPIMLRLRRLNPVPARPRTPAPRSPNARWRSTPPPSLWCCGSHASLWLPHAILFKSLYERIYWISDTQKYIFLKFFVADYNEDVCMCNIASRMVEVLTTGVRELQL